MQNKLDVVNGTEISWRTFYLYNYGYSFAYIIRAD